MNDRLLIFFYHIKKYTSIRQKITYYNFIWTDINFWAVKMYIFIFPYVEEISLCTFFPLIFDNIKKCFGQKLKGFKQDITWRY